jgi:GR25 family glycosyltransferase involved in LPS biosynthesis
MKTCNIILLICIVILLVSLIYSILNNRDENFTLHNNLEQAQSYVLYIPKREKYIKNVMNKIGIDAKYILGPPKDKVNREKLFKEGMLSKKYYDMNKKEEKGEVAVFLGHVSILKEFLKSNNKYALIFEDDIFLPKKQEEQKVMGKKISNLIKNIPEEADMVYFGYCFEDCKKAKPYKGNPKLFNHAVVPVCLHSYLVSRKGARKLLDLVIPLTEGIDVAILHLIRQNKINAFTVNKDYLQVLQNRKDLGSDISNIEHAADIPVCRIGNWTGNPRN